MVATQAMIFSSGENKREAYLSGQILDWEHEAEIQGCR